MIFFAFQVGLENESGKADLLAVRSKANKYCVSFKLVWMELTQGYRPSLPPM